MLEAFDADEKVLGSEPSEGEKFVTTYIAAVLVALGEQMAYRTPISK